ncbi:3'(2'),5'-bisphosphate nucleotidase [Madurella fahalii]|uniref:3'(2'),5'-bisphosphate nucleotidase n=1 Tax=Madurella fahalii TaxID=1157608 RepID=A0ABQ0G7W9_9PEZI
MESPYRHELEVAIRAAQSAAHISRLALSAAQAGEHAGTFDVVKDDLSPVTVADFAIQALLTRSLRDVFPRDGFVGEESADELRQNPKLSSRVLAILGQGLGDPSRFPDAEDLCEVIDSCTTSSPSGADSASGRVWIFDPIDGTKTFIRREQYAINIALLDHGRQLLSVVACPLLSADATAPVTDASTDPTGTGCILYAVRGHGAYVRPLPGDPGKVESRRLERHADNVSLDHLRCVTCWAQLDSGVSDVHEAVAEKLNVPFPGCDLLGWVPRWAVISLGLANVTVWVYKKRDRYAKIWDHAGAMLLFEEVGGVITDVHGKPIDLSSGRKLNANFGFVAAPRNLHHIVLRTVQDVLREQGKEELLL